MKISFYWLSAFLVVFLQGGVCASEAAVRVRAGEKDVEWYGIKIDAYLHSFIEEKKVAGGRTRFIKDSLTVHLRSSVRFLIAALNLIKNSVSCVVQPNAAMSAVTTEHKKYMLSVARDVAVRVSFAYKSRDRRAFLRESFTSFFPPYFNQFLALMKIWNQRSVGSDRDSDSGYESDSSTASSLVDSVATVMKEQLFHELFECFEHLVPIYLNFQWENAFATDDYAEYFSVIGFIGRSLKTQRGACLEHLHIQFGEREPSREVLHDYEASLPLSYDRENFIIQWIEENPSFAAKYNDVYERFSLRSSKRPSREG